MIKNKRTGFIFFATVFNVSFSVIMLICVMLVYKSSLVLMLNHNKIEKAFETAEMAMNKISDEPELAGEVFMMDTFEVQCSVKQEDDLPGWKLVNVQVRQPGQTICLVNLMRYEK